ncbi:four helix bundle protein [Deltaproteobacteria bacterium TL4]
MAYYENLPIYKKTMELAVLIENMVRDFARYHKYSIGQDMRELSRQLVTSVIKANSEQDKYASLTELRNQSEAMKTTLLIGKEIKAFKSFAQFQQAAHLITDICKQSEGWLKSQKGKKPESPVT